jgi:hypothetical protein
VLLIGMWKQTNEMRFLTHGVEELTLFGILVYMFAKRSPETLSPEKCFCTQLRTTEGKI